jgi:hypothetical protein
LGLQRKVSDPGGSPMFKPSLCAKNAAILERFAP